MEKEALKKQLFMNLAEELVKQGLLAGEEKNSLMIILNSQRKNHEKSRNL